MKLAKKLTLSFVFSIFVSIVIISFISNLMINNRFENYLIQEREDRFQIVHEDINSLIIQNDFILDEMDLIHYALKENINIEIINTENVTIYNSDTSKGMGRGMHMGMMNSHHRASQGNYVEKSFPLTDGNQELGRLIIGYIDNAYLTNSALIFKDTLFKSILISGLITISLGLIISISLSKGLTNPIIAITNTANRIKDGNLNARSIVNTKTHEILELSDSINYLASALSTQKNIRKKYAADISHELRTPLTTLQSHLEAIIDGVWEPTAEHLDILMNEISRLSNLVDDLKNSFTHEEYNINLDKAKFNISTELENIITSYMPIFNMKDYNIEYSIEEDIMVEMDKDKFNQIINNLLSNSLKYLHKDGQISVNLEKLKDSIIIKIKDNGSGIKKEDLPFVFERFYRTDSSRDKSTGGTGLGLPIVKSIVEAHHGEIKIHSIYELGTEVTIKLPVN